MGKEFDEKVFEFLTRRDNWIVAKQITQQMEKIRQDVLREFWKALKVRLEAKLAGITPEIYSSERFSGLWSYVKEWPQSVWLDVGAAYYSGIPYYSVGLAGDLVDDSARRVRNVLKKSFPEIKDDEGREEQESEGNDTWYVWTDQHLTLEPADWPTYGRDEMEKLAEMFADEVVTFVERVDSILRTK